MNKSIGRRLFFQMMLVLLIFIIIALLANTLFIKPVYSLIKKQALIETSVFINSLDGKYEENLKEISEYEERLSAGIFIYDDAGTIYFSAGRIIQGKMMDEFGSMPRGRGSMMGPSHDQEMTDIIIGSIPRIIKKSEIEEINSIIQNNIRHANTF